MAFWEAIKLGIENILTHKLRSFLTMLGMVFGVGAVISMLSIGSGAKEEALQQVRALGIDNIWVKSQKPPEPEEEKATDTSSPKESIEWGLTVKDIQHLKAILPNISYAIPLKEVREDIQTKTKIVKLQVIATMPEYLTILGLSLNKGRFITPLDFDRDNNICVLGSEAKRILFGPYKNPLTEYLRIGDDYFRIVGIINEKSVSKSSRDVNRVVYIPFTPELKKTRTSWSYEKEKQIVESEAEVDEICLQVQDELWIGETERSLRHSLKKSHPKQDYEIMVPRQILEQSQKTQRIFNIVMGSIAAISLLVGGIGIMNIMLATVTERTREIGIRRALGARRKDIIKQFLIETLVLASIGGLVGILAGIAGAKSIPLLAGGEYKTVISSYPILAAFFISLSIGVIFGMYPAYKAANIHPIEALRYE